MCAIQGAILCLISRCFNVKQINVKSKHDDRDGGSCFVMLKGNNVNTNSATEVSMSIKAISIQAVSQRMFLILDSHGDLHLLSLSNSGIGVDVTGNVRQLPRTMKVKSVAVLPDLSSSIFLKNNYSESGEGLAGSGDHQAVKAAVAVGGTVLFLLHPAFSVISVPPPPAAIQKAPCCGSRLENAIGFRHGPAIAKI
ncbi:hypothetical protein LR48_Vigan10g195300 [Vigna angularis]|uniref:Uncharacterized protein n=1 Tax=Phaseolus angularis TaxID=3914 RepID=A0A0L9VLX8_PHAAN|nr:hypothetical protein LR48_Vigan10g195300 [Vigna angularis]